MRGKFCQTEDYLEVTSWITGRTVLVNHMGDKVLVPKTFQASAARLVIERFISYNDSYREGNSKLRGVTLRLVRALADASSALEFADRIENLLACIDNQIASYKQGRGPKFAGKSRITDLFCALWQADCLVWPRNGCILGRTPIVDRMWGFSAGNSVLDVFDSFEKASEALSDRSSRRTDHEGRRRMVVALLLSTGGAREIGDFVPEVVAGWLGRESANGPIQRSSGAKLLAKMIRHSHPQAAATLTAHDYATIGKRADRTDSAFLWVLKRNDDLKGWVVVAAEWLQSQKGSYAAKRATLNRFFDLLITNSDLPRDPLDALRRDCGINDQHGIGSGARNDTLSKRRMHLFQFFEYILDTRCIEQGDDDLPYRIPGFRNPINVGLRRNAAPAETHREALPLRYIRMLKEIIEENDFEWPRRLREDYFQWYDARSGTWTRIWSPVRARSMQVKLELPLRTFQVRVLNSGEGDYERFDIDSGKWKRNEHALAGQEDTPKKGVLRKLWDRNNKCEYVGLYINTNKTQDVGCGDDERGYVIPWQHERVIRALSSLREWQEHYNPLRAPTPWIAIAEAQISQGYHKDVLASRGAETFLFRDPVSHRPDQPIRFNRLLLFWIKLCEELETRLARLGEVAPNGKPLALVKRNELGKAVGTVYDLHSLRVTLITALAEQGVPVDIIMKVAGHCSVIMTLYYQKFAVSHVTEILNAAQMRQLQSEQENWQRFLKSKSYEDLETAVAWNHQSGLNSLSEGSGASWIRQDHGICPVGCARCHEGGVELAKGSPSYGPVPGVV